MFILILTYVGSIYSADGMNIRGYLVQALDPSDARIGQFGISQFGIQTGQQKHLACSSVSAAIPDEVSTVLEHSA